MLKLYIADDEEIVRQGLKKIIDWEEHGFELCGEAGNGLQAYNDIRHLDPDLVLLDIRMPKLEGLDLASQLREEGFAGRIIILSGYSEFRYAQEAIRCDVDSYLTKPIDEDELLKLAIEIRQTLQKKKLHTEHVSYYQEKAKHRILEEMIGEERPSLASLKYSIGDLNLQADLYQVLIIEARSLEIDPFYLLCEDLKIPVNSNYVEQLKSDNYQVVLLKGEFVIGRFLAFVSRIDLSSKKNYFIATGHGVTGLNDIYFSYHEALAVYERRFFMNEGLFYAGKEELPPNDSLVNLITAKESRSIGSDLYELIKLHHTKDLKDRLESLKDELLVSKNSPDSVKSLLSGIYLNIVHEFRKNYGSYNLTFLTNTEIIRKIHEYNYLNHIFVFFESELLRMVNTISSVGSDNIVDEIIDYIKYHYEEDIKLKTLAPKFGYNSSYLGKIFTRKIGTGFNDYLHKTRTDVAKHLLLNKKYKVYEVSQIVGYKNVDYFHLKFKQFCSCTPNEYRIEHNVFID